jgi:hypothetical protein
MRLFDVPLDHYCTIAHPICSHVWQADANSALIISSASCSGPTPVCTKTIFCFLVDQDILSVTARHPEHTYICIVY